MRVETIELLRCPAAHESSPLITVAYSRDGDRLTEGTLGCVVCGAEYSLRGGVVYLGADVAEPKASLMAVDAERTAALLGLSEPGMRVVLCGAFGDVADHLEQATGAIAITVNATPIVHKVSHADHVVIGPRALIPLGNASLHGLALDSAHTALRLDAPRVVRVGGRVLAPATAPLPTALRELARDQLEWVAIVESGVDSPVPLRRGAAN